MKKVLLYSGGTDSWLIDKLWKPDMKLYIDIGSAYAEQEKARLPEDVVIEELKMLGKFEDPTTAYVPWRNLVFLTVAAQHGDNICLGAVAGDQGGRDKTAQFFQMTEDILNYCSHGSTISRDKDIKVETKYLAYNKYQLLESWLEEGGSLNEFAESTFSCYHPVHDKECWHCKPCYRKFLLLKYFGWQGDAVQEKSMLEYMKQNVIPYSRHEGTYFTQRPSEGPYAEKAMDRFFKEHGLDWRAWQ